MIKGVLLFLFTENMSLASVVVLLVASLCWFNNKYIACLLSILICGFISALIEVMRDI